ncbi:MAG: phosphoribosylaminoimidazolesuccinocarboxamide synthase [Armatimonadetes bacterium]|nr:phosphoribosylaminoimidazolesuccinocarboxamide synthase [Armatimonadota bacterium]CUU35114.1 phosphoribosylaminoimidazole-succinocarboxamide synthase [Armatimonadetes bacterium DC]
MSQIVYQTELPLPLHHRGKVRDMYRCGDVLLMVATDRLSAFDVVFPTPIPDKGRVLTQLSAFWFRQLETQGIAHHMLSVEWEAIADALRRAGVSDPEAYREMLEGRTMLIRPTKPYPVECVVRGYLTGSLWKEYCAVGGPQSQTPVSLHGISLPGGLVESAQLPEPIFTPATKATTGHDENISLEQASAIVGEATIRTLQALSLTIYRFASEYARARGILLADTKFEFGQDENGQILLIDEVLTPDSSRFWDAESYAPGGAQPSFDKQFVRDYVERLGWNKQPPAPELPDEIVKQTAMRYREAYRRLVGHAL